MAKNDIMLKIGSWSFIIGIVIASLVGLYTAVTIESGNNFLLTTNGGYVAWVLAIIGVIVGVLAVLGRGTITAKETPGFLIAGIALVVMYGVFKNAVINPWLGSLLHGISMSLSIFVAPAVGLLAIKTIYDMGKEV
ncbi:MAG: hypothetical protein DRM98_05135 [Thermoplasmata archaeon]|nr:MAG: hypothetical protein DRM98_05135 [Thermoplasmata archaeon]RLF52434.1 MAG: hypothetical protein DRN24_03270 [Thermoplasmata archaeon]